MRELAVQQRFLTEDEISDARAMITWQFWVAPIIFGCASTGLGIAAISGNPIIIFVFLLVFGAEVILSLSRVRDFKKINHDVEMRLAEVVEGAPEKVWTQRDGFCYVLLAGRTIRVPPDAHPYGSLRGERHQGSLPTDGASGSARGLQSWPWHLGSQQRSHYPRFGAYPQLHSLARKKGELKAQACANA